jgi:hypothetical protein
LGGARSDGGWSGSAGTGGAEFPGLSGIGLPAIAWVALIALPLIAGLVALVTARITVLRSLARMP